MGNSSNKLNRSFSNTLDSNLRLLRGSLRQSKSFGKIFGSSQNIQSNAKLKKSKSQQNIPESSTTSTSPKSSLIDTLFEPEYPLHGPITINDFQILNSVAQGAYGDVLRVLNRVDETIYAMKIMNKKKIYASHAVQQVKSETSIQMFACQQTFITMVYASFQSADHLHLVMKYEPKGDLFELWRKTDCFSELLTQIYISELALTLDFLHENGVIFRDLKMENILLDFEGHIKLTDFGLAKWLKKGQRTRTICGTLRYTAPELLSQNPYGHSIDWWSLGIIAYAMLLGEFPIPTADSPEEMSQRIAACTYDLPVNGPCISYQARSLIQMLLEKEPTMRIQSATDIEMLSFFESIIFDPAVLRQFHPIELWEECIESASGSRKSIASVRESAFIGFESPLHIAKLFTRIMDIS